MNTAAPKSVSVFGVRGAFPTVGPAFHDFGGNTSCMAVDCGTDLVVLDAGTGIVPLGAALAGNSQFQRIHIFISHVHLDHIQGLLGFAPLFDPESEIHIYGEQHDAASFRECLDRILAPPYWPIGLDDTACQVTVHETGPDAALQVADGLTMRTLRGCHPNGSLLYRLEDGAASIVHALDCELTDDIFPKLVAFAKDCTLLIWDANFTEPDLKRGWGHSTWKQGLEVARAARAKKILMTHYDRNYTDDFLREQERLARQADANCDFAREGMVIRL